MRKKGIISPYNNNEEIGEIDATQTETTYELPEGFGFRYTRFAFFLCGDTGGSMLYWQDGLIGQWDGIDNAGFDTHSDAPATWVDLTGNRLRAARRLCPLARMHSTKTPR